MYKLQRFQLRNILRCIYAGAVAKCDGWGVRMAGNNMLIETGTVNQRGGTNVFWKAYSRREGVEVLWAILMESKGSKKSAMLKKGILKNA